jgi:hypothetical protein
MLIKTMLKYTSLAIVIILVVSMVSVAYADSSTVQGSNIATEVVNPGSYYNKEPAPMGIADYGINSSGDGYYFNSTSFEGTIIISNLTTYNSSITQCPSNAGIQLNLIYRFNLYGENYTYWVQNVALINTSSKQIALIDNVWNFTTSSSVMYKSSISGNGGIHSSNNGNYYVYEANYGQFSEFSYSTLELRSTSFMEAGYPHINMQYNTGNGWITYDTLNFTFAGKASQNYGFIVDGSTLLSNNLPIDAGLILGGPGDGTQTKAVNVNITMFMEYWNGHNYQAIEDAYNHGSDTAEGICNITEVYTSYDGIPAVNLKSGSGTLGELYNVTSLSMLNFNTRIAAGYVTLNGAMFNFTGGAINLTLVPGTYSFKLFAESGQEIFHETYTFYSDNVYALEAKHVFIVNFNETGLSNGIEWNVIVNGTTMKSSSSTIVFLLSNGSYNYEVPGVAGYSISENNGTFNINGTSENINVTFSKIPVTPGNSVISVYDYKLIITAAIISIVAVIALIAILPDKKHVK